MEHRFRHLLEQCQSGIAPNPKDFSTLDWEFHDLIIQRCQNTYIKSIMHTNTTNMKRYQYLSAEALNDVKESTLQHLNILSLLRERDPEALANALKLHLDWASSFLKSPDRH